MNSKLKKFVALFLALGVLITTVISFLALI